MTIEIAEEDLKEIREFLYKIADPLKHAVYVASFNHSLYESPFYVSHGVALHVESFIHKELMEYRQRFALTGTSLRRDGKMGMLTFHDWELDIGLCVFYEVGTDDPEVRYTFFKHDSWKHVPKWSDTLMSLEVIPWFENGICKSKI